MMSCSNSSSRFPLPEKPRQKRAVIQDMVRPLKKWLLRHRHNPYPTKAEKVQLALGSNMTLVQVENTVMLKESKILKIHFTSKKWTFCTKITLLEIFIFCTKIQLWFSEKIVDFFGVKNSWKCCNFGLFSCWQLWFHEKNCQKHLSEKLVKTFGQKFDFSNSV